MSTCNDPLQACNDPIATNYVHFTSNNDPGSTEMSCLQSAMTQFQLNTIVLQAYNDPTTACNDPLQANNDPMSTNNGHY